MEPRRLVLVPQLPVKMRYQEWWPVDIVQHIGHLFSEVVVLGSMTPPVRVHKKGAFSPSSGDFSITDAAINYELMQIEQYLSLPPARDVLLHCDLSFPGLFHPVLLYRKPALSIVMCHATSRNRYDFFHPVRTNKWMQERAHAKLYDYVLVATEYHEKKLGFPNIVNTHGLPLPPSHILPERMTKIRPIHFCSTARPCIQKVDLTVEKELRKLTGEVVHRYKFTDWSSYYQFLDRCEFLIVTAKEETYGYQVIDALLRGCIPIAPGAYSFCELLPEELLYDPNATAKEKAEQITCIVEQQRKKRTEVTVTSEFYHILKGILL